MGKHQGCAHSSAQLRSHLAGGHRLALAGTGASDVGCGWSGMPWSSVLALILDGKLWTESFAICMCCPAALFCLEKKVVLLDTVSSSACNLGSYVHC